MTYILAALALLLVIDWRQTLTIARNPWRWYERNPILGKHPSTGRVHVWFALVSIAIAVAAHLLPDLIVLALALLGIVIEGLCVANNWRLGIRP